MKELRRVSPRIPYDETICLTRADGAGRYYVQTHDLGTTGMLVVSAESCAVGTDVSFSLLLPGGPRKVGGRVVRVSAHSGGYGLAIAFMSIEASVTVAIERLIAAHASEAMPAKLHLAGLEHALRCDAHAHVDEGTVRLTAALPFLRLDDGVAVQLGVGGDQAPGVIRNIALDPAAPDGIPRLAVDVALADRTPVTSRGAADAAADGEWTPPASKLPPPCGKDLPSVVVARAPERAARPATSRPPRRRVHGTAEVPRRPPSDDDFVPALAGAPAARVTARMELRRGRWDLAPGSWSYLLMIVPAALVIAALLRAM
jgi:hypothetical protein